MVNYNVLKAGGTSVGTPESMETIIEETLHIHGQALSEDQDSVTILVVSATGKQETGDIRTKNTDLLEEILRGENVNANIEEIMRREQRVLSHFGLSEDFNNENFQLMQRYLSSGDISDEEKHPLVATIVGERLKARQFESVLNLRRKDAAVFVDYDKSGVTTTGDFRNAKKLLILMMIYRMLYQSQDTRVRL
jgi:aspartokinase